jgi:hypothetical protein
MKGFCCINESKAPELTKDLLVKHAALLARAQDELDAWYQGTKWAVAIADSEAAAPQDDGWIIAKYQDQLDDKDALAYHTALASGRPAILIGVEIIRANVKAGTDWLQGPEGLLATADHEFKETRANPYVSLYVPLDTNRWLPQEICDPVQGDAYEYDDEKGLFLSNFVGPRYWSEGEGPYDRMGLVSQPKTIRPGGYQQILTGGPGGSSSSVFGAEMPAWRRVAKTKAGSRFAAIAAQATGTDELCVANARIAALEQQLANAATGHAQELAGVAADLKTAQVARAKAEGRSAQLEAANAVLQKAKHGNGGHGG